MVREAQDNQIGMIRGLGRIYRYALPYWKPIVLVIVSMMIYSVALNGRAYLVKPFLEQVILPAEDLRKTMDFKAALTLFRQKSLATEEQKKEQEQIQKQIVVTIRKKLFILLLVAFGMVTLMPAAGFLREYTTAYVSSRMIIDLQCDLCNKLLHMPFGFHTRQKKGELFARLNSDVGNAAISFQLILGDLIQQPLTLLGGICIMFVINWQLTLLISLVLPPLVFLTVRFGKKIRKKSIERQEKVGALVGSMIQMFSGIKVVKAFRMEDYEGERLRKINMELFRKVMKVEKTGATSRSVTDFFNNITYILLLGVGVWAIIKSMLGLTFPVLVVFMGLATTLYRPVKTLSQAYNKISESRAGIQRVYEIMDMETPAGQGDGTMELVEVRRGISFENVFFSYDGEKVVLRDITMEIKKGETVALVGKTGVGKTTLSDLILRFYDPTQGKICIDGVDIREFTRESLLRHIAVVTQEPFLFDTTVEENIRYGKPDATEEEIEEAARAAYIHEVIISLPQGYTAHVGDRGARLSGGERQRVTIARAILRNPSILILDEATASLDAESEKLVKDAIENLMRGRTTVVIAHRFSTIRNADKIVVMEDGQISMIGKHDELLRRGGLYKELCEMQFLHDENSSGSRNI